MPPVLLVLLALLLIIGGLTTGIVVLWNKKAGTTTPSPSQPLSFWKLVLVILTAEISFGVLSFLFKIIFSILFLYLSSGTAGSTSQ